MALATLEPKTTRKPKSAITETAMNYRGPLILVTGLFFMWGLSYGLLDVLNKHFQDQLSVSKAESGLLQMSYFGAYFIIALPASAFMNRFGYKRGILLGLALYALGALLFIPATAFGSYAPFLLALFVIACGAGCLETAANPYVTVLGSPEKGAFRLNLSQSFNGFGQFAGPLIGGLFFFGGGAGSALNNALAVRGTYVLIAIIAVMFGLVVWRTKMPEIRGDEDEQIVTTAEHAHQGLLARPHFIAGVATQFFYVAAQVGVAAFFINYTIAHWQGMQAHEASLLLSTGMICFTAGRFLSTYLMRFIEAPKLLAIYAVINFLLCALVATGVAKFDVFALIAVFFFESIMFPTIFALGIKDLGLHTKRGASFQVMSIIGGAVMPVCMGYVADHYAIATAYWLPAACFLVVLWFGLRGHRVRA